MVGGGGGGGNGIRFEMGNDEKEKWWVNMYITFLMNVCNFWKFLNYLLPSQDKKPVICFKFVYKRNVSMSSATWKNDLQLLEIYGSNLLL